MKAEPTAKFFGLNVNFPGKVYPLDATKYAATKRAMLSVLPKSSPGLTIKELMAKMAVALDGPLFPGGATLGWWIKAVQLDLEARGAIVREPVSPIRLRISGGD